MKEVIKIHRDYIVQALVNSTFDHIEQIPETLDHYLKYGFKGFEQYTDEELVREYRDYISEDPNEDIEIILEADDAGRP
jgi:squalene cyclase